MFDIIEFWNFLKLYSMVIAHWPIVNVDNNIINSEGSTRRVPTPNFYFI